MPAAAIRRRETKCDQTKSDYRNKQRTNTNDAALAPALVTALERLSHRVDIANALEREINTAISDFHQMRRLKNVFGELRNPLTHTHT